jgi:CubicO group peptidase (beta-lactamase class C family)
MIRDIKTDNQNYSEPSDRFSQLEMDECGQKLNFQFEPGTKYQYSGEGFEYLRKALEKKFGKTLEQLKELIFSRFKCMIPTISGMKIPMNQDLYRI